MSDYLTTGGLPIQLPNDIILLHNMLLMQKQYDNDEDMIKPIELKLKKLQEAK